MPLSPRNANTMRMLHFLYHLAEGGTAGYNIVGIPLAAGVLANWGILLSPAVGALLMSVSIIVVGINAQLIRRVTL